MPRSLLRGWFTLKHPLIDAGNTKQQLGLNLRGLHLPHKAKQKGRPAATHYAQSPARTTVTD